MYRSATNWKMTTDLITNCMVFRFELNHTEICRLSHTFYYKIPVKVLKKKRKKKHLKEKERKRKKKGKNKIVYISSKTPLP